MNNQQDRELHETKAAVYETWGSINRAFEQIISALYRLGELGILHEDYIQDHDTITNDLWSRINSQIMQDVGARERDDRVHYGKMRTSLEKRRAK
jgi:hypothetical protein